MAGWLCGIWYFRFLGSSSTEPSDHPKTNLPWALIEVYCYLMPFLILLAPQLAQIDHWSWTPTVSAVFLGTSRLLWASCFGCWFLLIVRRQLHLKFLNQALSSKLWNPLARLGYEYYMVHPVTLSIITLFLVKVGIFSATPTLFTWISIFTISFIATVILSIFLHILVGLPCKLIGIYVGSRLFSLPRQTKLE